MMTIVDVLMRVAALIVIARPLVVGMHGVAAVITIDRWLAFEPGRTLFLFNIPMRAAHGGRLEERALQTGYSTIKSAFTPTRNTSERLLGCTGWSGA